MAKVNFGKLISGNARSSSILEVTVALVIISITFGIFMMIYINLMAGNYYLQKLKYEAKISIRVHELLETGNYMDEVEEDDQVRIFKKVSPYKGSNTLKLIELRAIDSNGKILAKYKALHYDSNP